MAKIEIEYPKKHTTSGVLSFPITSEKDLEDLAAWRLEKGIKKPKFADKISVNLLLNEQQYERVVEYLETVYLPFVDVLYKETNGDKGIEPALVKGLLKQVKDRDWSEKNLPLRELTEKDRENSDDSIVAKLKIQGPYESEFKKKAIVKNDGTLEVTSLDTLIDDDVLPEDKTDYNALWWGAGWNFRTAIRMNAFDSANVGVSAYADTLYLLPHMGLPVLGGNSDADVVADGDDWE